MSRTPIDKVEAGRILNEARLTKGAGRGGNWPTTSTSPSCGRSRHSWASIRCRNSPPKQLVRGLSLDVGRHLCASAPALPDR